MYLLIALLFLIASAAHAQVDSLWSRTYGSPLDESCNALCETPDGGYLLVGREYSAAPYFSRARAVRTDSNGDTLWTRIFGGDTWNGFLFVKPTSDGGFILTGDLFQLIEGSWILKLSASGDSLWSTWLDYPDYQWALDAMETPDGGFVVISNVSGMEVSSSVRLTRINNIGEESHYIFYGDEWTSYGTSSIAQASDGGCVVAGVTSDPGINNSDFWLMKTDDNGDSLWSRSYGTQSNEAGHSVCQNYDGGYVIAGIRRIGSIGNMIWVVNTNVNGDSLWSRTLGDCDWYSDVSIAPTPDGSFLITATSDSSTSHARDFLLVKMSADGDSLWSRTFGGGGSEYCTSVAATSDGGYILGGYTYSFGAGAADFWLLKTTPELSADDFIPHPSAFCLSNFPNPFNATSTISFDLPRASHVLLNVFDLTGRAVATLADEPMSSGTHSINFDAAALPSGIYVYRLTSGTASLSRKFVLLK